MKKFDLFAPIQFVMKHADRVKVDEAAIDSYVAHFEPTAVDHWMKACPFTYHALPSVEDEVDRWFLSDAMAFCFWGYPTKWTIEYEGKKIDGWWALLACVQRELEGGVPLLDGGYLTDITEAQAKELFAGSPEIPLFAERLKIFREIGRTLVAKYDGRFHNFLTTAPHDATELVRVLATEFPTFDDVSRYKGETVYFYKKAQLLVHDLAVGFAGTRYGAITGLDELTGEADYKIPAILRKLGILVYDDVLSKKVETRTVLPADSPEEIEVRAGMLAACHIICERLTARGMSINPMTIDGILWVQSQAKSAADKPYHLTSTTDY